MNLSFSEEQQQLRELVRRFLDEHSSEQAVREQMNSAEGFDRSVWKQLAEELGLLGLLVPESLGGAGLGMIEAAIVMEEMGRALLCSPFFSTVVLAANTLIHSGDDAAKSELLPGIASGEPKKGTWLPT